MTIAAGYKPRIVTIRFYAYFYPPCIGGGEVILQHQAEELARRGHTVHVHTTPFTNMDGSTSVAPGSTFESGVHVHRRASRWINLRNPLEKNAVTPQFYADAWLPADLMVCVGFPSLHLDVLAVRKRLLGTPLVVQNYITADFLDEILAGTGDTGKRVRSAYWRHVVRRQLAAADVVLADSPAAGKALANRLSLSNVRTHIGMAVDPGEFFSVTPAARLDIRSELGLGRRRIILAPSRVSRQKGADLLIEAVRPLLPGAAVERSGWKGSGTWVVVISGPVNEPDFADSVRALAANSPHIVFTELPRAKLVALICEADIVALPSRGETVGGVVFEGMFGGATCIVSDAVEAARDDYLVHRQNGLLIPTENVGALRTALTEAMADPQVDIRAAGHSTVAERFTWSASVDRLLEFYPRA